MGAPSRYNVAYTLLTQIDDSIHKPSKIYPTLADGVTVTGAAGANTLGAFAEIVPVNTITSPFAIHGVSIQAASATDRYEVVLYAATVEIGRQRFHADSLGDSPVFIPLDTAVQNANTQIQAKLASKTGGSDTADVSIHYKEYA
jgi:hypothetical protein